MYNINYSNGRLGEMFSITYFLDENMQVKRGRNREEQENSS
jgi:hypothetical protein